MEGLVLCLCVHMCEHARVLGKGHSRSRVGVLRVRSTGHKLQLSGGKIILTSTGSS